MRRRVEKFQVISNIFSRVSSSPGCECPYCLFAILFSWFKWITLMAALNELILSQFEVSASHSLSFYCGTMLKLLCGGHLDISHFRGSFLFDNSFSCRREQFANVGSVHRNAAEHRRIMEY